VKKTLLQMTLAMASVAAVSVAQAQPAPTAPGPAAPPPAPTTTADPNAPPPPPSAAPTTTAAPVAPPPAATAPATPPPADVPPAGTAAPQGDPNAPPPPPPVAPPPAATTPVAPPPPVFVPPPATAVNWNAGAQGGDTTTPTDKPKPLRWRGTQLEWYQYANTQYFGVGQDYNDTSEFQYVHLYRFAPNFYIVDEKKDKLSVSVSLAGTVEYTHSNDQLQNEFVWRDTPITLKYARSLLESAAAEGEAPEWTTKGGVSVGGTIPTSKRSANMGLYTTLSAALNLTQQVKLLGSKSDLLPNLSLAGSMTYSHAFTRSTIPAGGAINIEAQDFAGNPITNDVASGKAWVWDNLNIGISATVPIYKDLSFAASYRYWMKWKPAVTNTSPNGCDVQLYTGCVKAEGVTDPATYFPDSIFDIALSYNFFDVVDAAVGYSNWTASLGPDGRINTNGHNLFYSPEGTFYLDLTANLDAIYSKASGRDKKVVAKGASSSSWF